jgi:hypothetical protein
MSAGRCRRPESKGGCTPRHPGVAATLLAAAALAGCAGLGDGPRVSSGGTSNQLIYSVGGMSFPAPAAWQARGDPRKVRVEAPDGAARIEAEWVKARFADQQECLDQASRSLERGSGGLQNVRRHTTTLDRKTGVAQEAEARGWHGWAWAVCDGTTQYRLFFTGRSPLTKEAFAAYKELQRTTIKGAP